MTTNKVIKLGEKFSEEYKLSDEEFKLLNRIDNSDYHLMNKDNLSVLDLPVIESLIAKDMIRYVKEHVMFPEGFSVTGEGTYALGIFDNL